MLRKGLDLAATLRSKKRPKPEPQLEELPQEEVEQATETAPERPPFALDRLPDYQSYMPFIGLLPPPIRGEDGEAAEEIRYQVLQESLFTAERWHERIEQIHLEGKIDQRKRDDFHEHIANVLDDLRNNVDPGFWLSVQDRPKNKFTHELIRDYLAENANNRPRQRSAEPRSGTTVDFFISADDFLSRECTIEPGVIVYHSTLKDGCIIYGPYRPYPVGLYKAKFDLRFSAKVAAPGLTIIVEVTQGERVLSSVTRDSLEMGYSGGETSLQFTNSDPGTNLEFRVHVSGVLEGSKVSFRGVSLFKV